MHKQSKHRIEYLQNIIDDLSLIRNNINQQWKDNEIGTDVVVMVEDFLDQKLKKYQTKLENEIK